MADDLKKRYDAINAKTEKLSEHVQAGVTSPAAAFGLSALLVEAIGLARDAMDRLEGNTSVAATDFNTCVDSVKWMQKPLDCQGVRMEGTGKIDIWECEIEGPCPGIQADIREYFARKD